MPARNKKRANPSSSSSDRSINAPGRRTEDIADPNVDKREVARKNLKPRSPRATPKGPRNR